MSIAHRDVKPENVLLAQSTAATHNGASSALDTHQSQMQGAEKVLCSCFVEWLPTVGCHHRNNAAVQAQLRRQKHSEQHAAAKLLLEQSLRVHSSSHSTNQATGCSTAASAKFSFYQVQQQSTQQLCSPSQHAAARLCDFGAAYVGRRACHPADHIAKTPYGSRYYCSPEVFRLMAMDSMQTEARGIWPPAAFDWQQAQHDGYNPYTADVWSFGVMLFTLCSGLKPFASPSPADSVFRAFVNSTQPKATRTDILGVHRRRLSQSDSTSNGTEVPRVRWQDEAGVVGSNADFSWHWPQCMSVELQTLVHACLQLDPAQRPSMQVCKHIWFCRPMGKLASTSSHCLSGMGTQAPTQVACCWWAAQQVWVQAAPAPVLRTVTTSSPAKGTHTCNASQCLWIRSRCLARATVQPVLQRLGVWCRKLHRRR